MQAYKHQQIVFDEDKKWTGIFYGTGAGKTFIGLTLAIREGGKCLVVCPKTQRDDMTWERGLAKIGQKLDLTVMSKEDLKKNKADLPWFDTVIIDEVHQCCGVTPAVRYRNRMPIPKTSDIYEVVLEFLKEKPPERFYPMTATPARNPMAVYALGRFLGKSWDFYKWRSFFYVEVPLPGRSIWMAKKDKKSKKALADIIHELGYVGKLDDWFDVPPQTNKVIELPLSKEQEKALDELPLMFPDPIVAIGKKHQIEQGFLFDGETYTPLKTAKHEKLLDITEEFSKVLIFARFTKEIEMISAYMKKHSDKKVLVLTGATKDRRKLMEEAERLEECIFISQCQISTGYELPSFRVTVFSSCSYSTVDHTQARGRVLRANALNKNLYIYLIGGEIDKAVFDCLENHRDFEETLYAKKGSETRD